MRSLPNHVSRQANKRAIPLGVVDEGAHAGVVQRGRGVATGGTTGAIGTSMCYWREAWERNPFPDRSEGCDDLEWLNKGVKISSVSSIFDVPSMGAVTKGPRMIASIHGGNLTPYQPEAASFNYRRVFEFDEYCRKAMQL